MSLILSWRSDFFSELSGTRILLLPNDSVQSWSCTLVDSRYFEQVLDTVLYDLV